MDVAVAGVAGDAGNEVVLFGKAQDFIEEQGFLIDGDDDVFFADDEAFGTDGFGKGLAGLPNLIVVGDEDRGSSVFRADFVEDDGFVVKVVFIGPFDFDDDVVAVVAALKRFVEVFFCLLYTSPSPRDS